MDGKQHFLIGIVTGTLLILITHFAFGWFEFTLINIILYFIISGLYGLLPDMDHKMSHITWFFIGTSILGLIYSKFIDNEIIFYFSLGLLILTFVCAKVLRHRGPVHTVFFGITMAIPLYVFVGLPESVLGLSCFISHLIADS